MAPEKHERYEVVGGREAGLLLYLRRAHFLAPNAASKLWNTGALDALVLPQKADRAGFAGAEEALVSAPAAAVPRYVLLVHQNLTRQPGSGR